MTATMISVQGTWASAGDRTPGGLITFKLTEAIINGATLYPAAPTSGYLDASGLLRDPSGYALQVPANDDSATLPQGTAYVVTAKITGQTVSEFTVVVNAASTASDVASGTVGSKEILLTSLIACSSMIGQPVSGTGVPNGTVVTAIDTVQNGIVCNNTITTTAGQSITVGGVVAFTTLQEDSQ